MITTCPTCGGWRGDPGDWRADPKCSCGSGPIPNTNTLQNHLRLAMTVGYLTGVLTGLRYRVDDETKELIDQALKRAGV